VTVLPPLTDSLFFVKVCGRLDVCDAACGGAGCGSCGGISCDMGAVTKANISLELVSKADKALKEKEAKTEVNIDLCLFYP